MSIQEVDGRFVISSRQVWIPGRYADERAARYAFRFPDAELAKLQASLNPGGCITFAMLQELRKEMKARAA